MKKVFLIFLAVMLISSITSGQIDVTGSNGADGSYTSLTNTGGAFEALNSSDQSGAAITILVTADVLTESGTVSLNENTWNSIQINPSGTRIISGSIAGGSLIYFNGADNVIINGLNDGANSLTLSNTGLGAASTIRFSNDATYNTISNCTLLGSGTVSFGVVYFGTGTNTGNDYNSISFCNIGPAGANLPLNGIYSMGSSAVIDNSNINIERNSIYDFFNASASTAGMNINSFNSTWTISENSIYQTAARTYTTGSSHYGIYINSGNGYLITGNFVGGQAPNAGGGAYTVSGAVASRYWGIYLTVGTSVVSSIQGNTITNFNVSSTAANNFFNGIIVTGGNVNIGTDSGNTIGSGSAASAIIANAATSAGQAIGIFASSTGTCNIYNNTIGGITMYGASVSISASIQGIYLGAGNPTVFRNTIGSNSVANSLYTATASTSTTSAQFVIGINVTNGITVPITISSNTIANLTQAGTTSVHYIRGISYSGTGTGTITDNVIHDIRGASSNTTQAGGGTAVQGIIYTGASANAIIKNNTFYTIYATNTGAVATTACAIGYSNPFAGTISENTIYDIRNASTGVTGTTPPCAIGILIRALQGPTTFANNMISLGEGQTTNTQFAGFMNSFTAGQLNAYYNSVYIAGSVSTGALPSFCFYRGNNSATPITTPVDIRNNIFVNNRNGGTGKHYAISNNYGATASTTGWGANASNYNVLNGNAATIGYWSGDQTFTGWKTVSSCDLNSISNTTVVFSNTTVANLHLNMGMVSTQLESGGTVIAAVTTDFDGDTRPGPVPSYNGGGTAPDFGADEFDGVPLDLSGPVISYTPLLNTNLTASRTLVATITDPSGVPVTAPGWPILYWKKTGDLVYTAVSPASVSGSDYTYNFGGGVNINDVVSYYIVAQDNSTPPNVAAYPFTGAGGFSYNPPAVSTPPSNPSTYSILTPLSGDYTVGLADFNMLAGRNISFRKVVNKVYKEVWVPETPSYQKKSSDPKKNRAIYGMDDVVPGFSMIDGDESTAPRRLPGSYKWIETEEISWLPVENGKLYEGPLFITASDPEFSPGATFAGAYATITAAVADLNARGLSGPVRFLLIDPSYTVGETYPVIININNINSTTSVNTVTIKPNTGITASVSGASASAEMFRIYKTNYVTIDGSNTTGGTTRDLTITNTSTTSPETIDILSNGTTPITGCGVKNCNLVNGANTGIGVFVGDISGNAGYFNDLTLQNNSVQTAAYGIYCIAVASAGNGSGLNISDNTLNASGASAIRLMGLYIQGADGVTVANNSIGNIANTTESSNLTGIWLASGTINATVTGNSISGISGTLTSPRGMVMSPNVAVSNSVISGNTVTGLTSSSTVTTYGIYLFTPTSGISVERNLIYNIKNTNTGGWGSNAITLASTSATAAIYVRNNVIYDVASYGYGAAGITENGYGMVVDGGAGYYIYNNSIHLNTDQNVAGWPAALLVTSGVTANNAIDLKNNIFANTQSLGTDRYAVYSMASAPVYSDINHNIYYTTGANLGYLGSNRADLAAWQAATGKDLQSISANPNFQSSLLELTGGSSPAPGGGFPLAAVADDYSGDPRDSSYPTIGAHEYPYATTWTANGLDNNWFSAANWTTPVLPGINMVVTIPSAPAGGSIFPVIAPGSTGECKTIDIQNGANVTVQTSGTLNILTP